jgi:hypothetical protein
MEINASHKYVASLLHELVVTEAVLMLVRFLELVHVDRGAQRRELSSA